jgi:hypothetical protein
MLPANAMMVMANIASIMVKAELLRRRLLIDWQVMDTKNNYLPQNNK